jgi:heterotetrameric sarcosine oxidase gamma subunit
MKKAELAITRVAPRYVSLLQIHGSDSTEIAPLVVRILHASDAGRSPTSRAYSVGPSDWLLVDYSLSDMRRRLSADLGRALVRLTDVSAEFTTLRVEGAFARTVLGSDIGASCAVMTARAGEYAQTRLAQIEVILHCIGPDSFELHVDRSVAEDLETWLVVQHEAHTSNRIVQ